MRKANPSYDLKNLKMNTRENHGLSLLTIFPIHAIGIIFGSHLVRHIESFKILNCATGCQLDS